MASFDITSRLQRSRSSMVTWIDEVPEPIKSGAMEALDRLMTLMRSEIEAAYWDGYRERKDVEDARRARKDMEGA
jgi:hypothetical protein